MADKSYVYTADLDDEAFLETLERMEEAAIGMAERAGRAFSRISTRPQRQTGDSASESPADVGSSQRRVEEETRAQSEINLLRRNEVESLEELARRRIALGAAAVTAATKQEREILKEAVRVQAIIIGEAKRTEQARRQSATATSQATVSATRQSAQQRVESESRADATIALLRRNNARTLEEIAQRQIALGRTAVETRTRLERQVLNEAVVVKRAEVALEKQATQEIVQLARQRARQEQQLARQRERAEREAARAAEREARQTSQLRASSIAKLTVAYNLLAQAIVNAARKAAQFFADQIKQSVQAATSLQGVETSFGAVFGRGSEASLAVITQVREQSKLLGIDLTQITRRILPLVESVEQAVKVGELAASLARLDPLQGEQGALTALNEALAGGDLRSLRLRFEIPTDDIREAQNQLGDVEGLIEGLGKVLRERGVDFSQLADTFDVSVSIMRQRIKFLREEFGEPIIDQLNEQVQRFNEFLTENEDDIVLIADALGTLVANVIELGSQVLGVDEFFETFNSSAILDQIVHLEKLLSLVKGLSELSQPLNREFIPEEIRRRVFDLETALEALIKVLTIVNAEWRSFNVALQEGGQLIAAIATGSIEDVTNAIEDFSKAATDAALLKEFQLGLISKEDLDRLQQGSGVIETYFAEIERGVNILNDAAAAERNAADAIEEKRQEMEAATAATTDAANAALQLRNANDAISEAQSNLAEAQAEVAEKISDAQRDFAHGVMDAVRDAERARLDLERETAEKRVDLARENAQEIADIIRKNSQRVIDAARDLQRQEAQILRRHTDRIAEIEQESANERVDIEEDFRRQLEDIRRRFDFEAEEAIRQNDAVALLRIRRRMRFELEEASRNRDQRVEDERTDRERAIEEERLRVARQLEEARIANQEKLEDLRIALQRELEEQATAHERELEEIKIAEERKRAEIELSLERQLEDLQIALQRKLEELQSELDDEQAALAEAEAAKMAILEQGNTSLQGIMNERVRIMQNAAAQINAALGSILGAGDIGQLGNTSSRNTPGDERLGNAPPGSFDDIDANPPGSSIPPPQSPPTNPNAGTPADPNLPVGPPRPRQQGINSAMTDAQATSRIMFAPPPPATQTSVTIDNSRKAEVSLSMLDPTAVTPTQAAIMRKIALDTYKEAIS